MLTRAASRWSVCMWVLAAACTGLVLAQNAPDDDVAEVSLADFLHELDSKGIPVVFTNDVVRPTMRVSRLSGQRDATAVQALLERELTGLGLELVILERDQEAPVWVIAKAKRSGGVKVPVVIEGRVQMRNSKKPLPGSQILLRGGPDAEYEALSLANGGFTFESVPPGEYTLEGSHPGFVPRVIEQIVVRAGARARLEVELEPLPLVQDEVLVRSSEITMLQEEPVSVSLSREAIETVPHLGDDVFRSLSLTPGVSSNDVSAALNIRGGRRDETLVRLDGQELYQAFHLQDYDSALSLVATQGLADARLSTGNFAANTGDRMSGVLDLRTGPADDGALTTLSLSLLSAYAAHGGVLVPGADPEFDRGRWFLSARRGALDLAGRVIENEDPSFWDALGKVDLELGIRHRLQLRTLLAGDQLSHTEVLEEEAKSTNTEYDNSYYWMNYQAVLSRQVLLEAAGGWSRIERDRVGQEREEEQSFDVFDRRLTEVSRLSSALSWYQASGQEWNAGFEARRYDADYAYLNEAERTLSLSTPVARPAESLSEFTGGFRGEHLGLFARNRFRPAARLTAELGARYDRHSLTDDTLLSPRVSLAYRFPDRGGAQPSVLRLGWGHHFQSQRPYELAVEDGQDRFARAERSKHLTLGYERLFGDHERAPLRVLRLEAFRRDIGHPRMRFENLFEPINTFPEVEPDRVRIEPLRARSYGLEVVARGALSDRVSWWGNYSVSRAEDRFADMWIERSLDQPHAVNLMLHVRLPQGWNLSTAWIYHTGWPTTPVAEARVIPSPGGAEDESAADEAEEDEDEAGQIVVVPGEFNSSRLSAYHRLDVRLSRRFKMRRGELLFFVDVQNLYDRQNDGGFDFSEEDGTVQRSSERWPGIFPSIGVTWTF